MSLKKSSGFTLIELVIVIVIVGILSLVAVPIYRNYIRRAMASEGVTLMGSVASAQKVYYAEHTSYYAMPAGVVSVESTLGVNAGSNKYFRFFSGTGAAATFRGETSAETAGDASGIAVNVTGTPTAAAVITTTGLEL